MSRPTYHVECPDCGCGVYVQKVIAADTLADAIEAYASSCTAGALKALNRGATTEQEAHDRTERWEAVLNALAAYRASVDQTEERH